MRRRLQLLAEASAVFAEATLDPNRLTEIIARKVTDAVGDNCAVLLLDEPSGELRPVAFFHRDPEAQGAVWRALAADPVRMGEGILGSVAQTGTPVLMPVVDVDSVVAAARPEYRPLLQKYPPRSFLAAPLLSRGRTLGVIGMSRLDPAAGPYTEDDVTLVEDLAERAAMAIEVAQLIQRERAATERALALAEASKTIQTLDHEQAVAALVRVGATLVGDACVVTLLEDGVLRTKFGAHRDPAAEERIHAILNEPIPMDRGILAQVLRENRPIRIEDARGFQGTMQAAEEYRKSVGFVSILICPMRVEDKVIGTLGLTRDPGRDSYTPADEMFVQELADRAALVIHNARLYEAAEDARREAEKASRLKDEFLSAASHELRTPITTIQLMIQTTLRQVHKLGQGQIPAQWLHPRLEKADSQARRLVGLIDDLLEVSRIGAGQLEVHAEAMDLCELIRSVAARFEEQAAEAGSELTVVAPESLAGCWDRGRLDQVVTNLMTNAIKYGRGKPITIEVSAAEGAVRIAVIDRGIGVAPEHQARIFERFERAEPVRNYGGFGIGLWIVREIVTRMGGSIRVESRLAEGATFVVELPT